MTRRGSFVGMCRFAAATAALALTACVNEVRLAPTDASWKSEGSVATWSAEPVTVFARLDTDAGELPARGRIENAGMLPVRVAFVPAGAAPDREAGRMGDLAKGLPDAVVPGATREIPAAGLDGTAGVLEFALRADEPWGGEPSAGASISWTIVVTTPAGESRCPFRFRVESVTRALSQGARTGIVIVIVGAALVLVADAVHDEWSDFSMSLSMPGF